MAKIDLSFTTAETILVENAARAAGVRNVNAFARAALLEKASEILRLSSDAGTDSAALHLKPSTLYAYIGKEFPGKHLQPAALFPSIRTFATFFADDVRAVLRFLSRSRPQSVAALARHFPGYHYQKVARDLRRLSTSGVIAYDAVGDRELAPRLCHTCVSLLLPLTGTPPERTLRVAVSAAPTEIVPENTTRAFGSMNDFAAFLTDRNLEFLTIVGTKRPESIIAIARMTGRDNRNTYPAIRKLANEGLIRIEGQQPTRPVLVYDAIMLDLAFDR